MVTRQVRSARLLPLVDLWTLAPSSKSRSRTPPLPRYCLSLRHLDMLIESKKRKRDITVTVARHGSEPLSRRLLEHIKQEAATESKILQLDRTSQFTDLDGLQAGCAEDASKWNTLLLAARADRGPQWDNGTQLYVLLLYLAKSISPKSYIARA